MTISLLSFLSLSNTALLIQNIEAMSQSEGTAVNTCYIKGAGMSDSFAVFCDDKTNVNVIGCGE